MIYLVAKTLLNPAKHVRYRDANCSLRSDPAREVRALIQKLNVPQEEGKDLPHETQPQDFIDPLGAVRNYVIPTNELDRIIWKPPQIEYEDMLVKGRAIRGGRTTIEGNLYYERQAQQPTIRLVFS